MDSDEALRAMLQASGLSQRAAASAVGRSPSFVSVALARGSDLQASTLATMAGACGYSLQLVPRDSSREVLTISPRETPGKAGTDKG